MMRRVLSLGAALLVSTTAFADQAPPRMRALQMHEYGSSEILHIQQVSVPTPAAGEVRIRIHAAAVNPIDWKIRSGRVQRNYPVSFPYIPGRDVSGTIDAVGSDSMEER